MRAKVPSKILSASSSRRSPFEAELIFWSESLQILFDFQIIWHLAPKTNLLVIKQMSLKTIYTNFYDTSWSGANSMSAFSPTLTFAIIWGSGCGSVGRAVASDSRGLQFESSHRQKFILNIYCQLYWKDENKEKRPGLAHFYLKKDDFLAFIIRENLITKHQDKSSLKSARDQESLFAESTSSEHYN